MEEKKTLKIIDLRKIIKKIGKNRKVFYKTLPVAFILACIYIFSIPRYYASETKLAPEIDNSLGKGALNSIASSFGFDIGEMQTSDAITPLLYPNLMEDNGFVANLFSLRIKNEDGTINSTYYDYLATGQKKPWWNSIFSFFKSEKPKELPNSKDPYNLSKPQDDIAEKIRNDITIHVNSKSGVITITTQAQDPYICKALADSVREQLQAYITTYRTNKARIDYEYYKQVTAEAKQDYERARQRYGAYIDGNVNIAMQSVRLKAEEMESEMELKLNNYNTFNTQMQSAKAKIQERTPAFTILKGAAVPTKPAAPKRMIFVAVITLLAFIGTSIWIIRKDISEIFV